MNQLPTRNAGAAVLAAILLSAAVPAARADTAKIDQAFLDTQAALIDSLVQQGSSDLTSPTRALEVAHRLLQRRETGLVTLGKTHPLTSFDGIETQDRFDRNVVEALNQVVTRAVEADTTLPPQSQAVLFNKALPMVPALGDKPVAFMVVGMAEASYVAADSLIAHHEVPPRNVAKLALRLMRYATTTYRNAQVDPITAAKAEAMRQSSVILRMRCPKDGGTYKVVQEKNKMHADGSLSRIYWLNCTVCGAPQALEFPLPLASRLNKAGSRQILKETPKAKQPDDGLKP
jgi:hypothetical protein